MKLSMHSNAEEGLLLIEFDNEGREKLLGDIERTIAQQDHEFDVLDAELTTDAPRGGNWKLNDFYNISWVPDEDAPLHVDDSVYISGSKTALMDLYNRIRLLPADCKEFELAAEHSTPRRKRFRFSWLLGGVLSILFLIPAADRFFVAAFSGKDDYFFQMWCYLACALAVLPMPKLIVLHSIWSTRLNAMLGLLCASALMLLNLQIFGAPSKFFFLSDTASLILLSTLSVIFASTSICAFFRRGLRRATASESARLRMTIRLLGIFLIIAVQSLALLVAGISHDVTYCEGKNESIWHLIIIAILIIALYAQPLWLFAEILKKGLLKKLCYILTACALLPGLLTAAPIYILEFKAELSTSIRITLAVVILTAAISLFFYLRRQILK